MRRISREAERRIMAPVGLSEARKSPAWRYKRQNRQNVSMLAKPDGALAWTTL
jgi:hypothetical protein